ncbi:hypothetical protein HDV05_007148, partial [Chytridiales sp. JEL 0842]
SVPRTTLIPWVLLPGSILCNRQGWVKTAFPLYIPTETLVYMLPTGKNDWVLPPGSILWRPQGWVRTEYPLFLPANAPVTAFPPYAYADGHQKHCAEHFAAPFCVGAFGEVDLQDGMLTAALAAELPYMGES